MEKTTKITSGCESMKPKLESMKSTTYNKKSNQPNVTSSNQQKPSFTPPAQKKTSTEK